jgi:predicted permease
MNWTRWIKSKKARERELNEEIEADFALEIQRRLEAGEIPEEVEFAVRRDFGNVARVKEVTREMWGWGGLERLLQDTRYALRQLRNAPAFAVTTVLMLALGIGATTAIFTLVYAVLLKSLAVANPQQLYRLGKESTCCYHTGYSQDKEWSMVSYDLYQYLRDNTKAFAELAAFQSSEPQFGIRRSNGSESAQSFPGEFVSGNYFTMFGIRAYAGRMFTAQDDEPNAPPTAVMSYSLWRQRYGADPSVIGSVFDINEKPFTIVGVTPPNFFGDRLRNNPPDLFLPLNTEPLADAADPDLDKYNTHWLDLIGRVRPGTNLEFVEAEMRVELKQWLRAHWGEMSPDDRAKFREQTLYLRPGGAGITSMREDYEHWLEILMLASGFVLLIVCANVANLMMVRGLERRRQISVSMALGARSFRLVRQALTESIVLSLFGGAAGLAVAFAGARLILHFAFPSVSGLAGVPINASPSPTVLLFALGTSLLTGVAFGIAPAWMATRADPIEALRGAGRATVRSNSLPRKTLVVFEAALSLVLLSTSGLLMAALHKLENQNFGFDQDRRIVANVNPLLAGYRMDQLTPLYRRIQDSLSNIPGVAGAALCQYSPLSGNEWGSGVWVEGAPPPGPNDDIYASLDRVTPGYFNVIGNPIAQGRGISEYDTATSRHVAVINEAFARKFFQHEDPIGKHFGRMGIGSGRQYEVVGVAEDARYFQGNLGKPAAPLFFLPESQHDLSPQDGSEVSPGSHFLKDVVIVTKPGATLSDAQVRRALASVDPNLPVSIHSLKEQVDAVFAQQRLIAKLTSLFGLLSLALASIGLYGVTAYNAGRLVTEIGVRMALGANRLSVVGLVLRGAFALIIFGLTIGLPLTFAAGKFLGNQLYGMSPYNLFVTVAAVLTLGFSALIASLIPALRASWISPMEALRTE